MNSAKKSKLLTRSYMIVFLINILTAAGYNAISSVVPLLLTQRMNASKSEIGLVLGISSFFILIVRPFLGYLLDRFDRKKFLFLSLLMGAFLYFAFLFVKTPVELIIVWTLGMVFNAVIVTALLTQATDIIPEERRGEGIGLFANSSTLAIAIGPVIALPLFKSQWYGWPFVLAGIFNIFCIILCLFIKEPSFNYENEAFSISSIIDKRVLNVVIIGGIAYMGIVGIFSYAALYATDIGLTSANASAAFIAYATGLLLTRILASKLIDNQGPRFSVSISLFLLAIGLGIMGFWSDLPGFLGGALFVGIGIGTILPAVLSMSIKLVPPHRRGICNSLVFTGTDFGRSIGGLIFGFTADYFQNYRSAYILFSFIELLGVFIFLFITFPKYKKDKEKVIHKENLVIG